MIWTNKRTFFKIIAVYVQMKTHVILLKDGAHVRRSPKKTPPSKAVNSKFLKMKLKNVIPPFVLIQWWDDWIFVVYALVNVIWSTLYLEHWKRESAEHAYKWGTLDKEDELLTEPRPLYTVSYSLPYLTYLLS